MPSLGGVRERGAACGEGRLKTSVSDETRRAEERESMRQHYIDELKHKMEARAPQHARTCPRPGNTHTCTHARTGPLAAPAARWAAGLGL